MCSAASSRLSIAASIRTCAICGKRSDRCRKAPNASKEGAGLDIFTPYPFCDHEQLPNYDPARACNSTESSVRFPNDKALVACQNAESETREHSFTAIGNSIARGATKR